MEIRKTKQTCVELSLYEMKQILLRYALDKTGVLFHENEIFFPFSGDSKGTLLFSKREKIEE